MEFVSRHLRARRRFRPIAIARTLLRGYAVAAMFLLASASEGFAGLSGLERLASGFGVITTMDFAPGDPTRLFVGLKGGTIRILDLTTNTVQPTPFLTISGLDTEVEGGLLGLAFHPDYQHNGKFYVQVTVDNGGIPIDEENVSPFSSHLREYTVSSNPNVANTEFVNLDDWVQPQTWHNGGWLGFGPQDGYLYVLTGDGGASFDTGPGHTPGTGNAQDLTDNRLGKLLRIDVDGDDFPLDPLRNYAVPPDNPFVGQAEDDEIFAYGLRSPWKASFDRATGDLWIGDVGEATREEVSMLPGGSGGGQNFGWNKREGSIATPTVGGPLPGSVEPVYDYGHLGAPGDPAFQGNSVTGGYRYRGPDPDFQGKYIFADYSSDQIWMFDPDDPVGAYSAVINVTALLPPSAGTASRVTTFAEDPFGNLYVGTLLGNVFRIATNTLTGDLDSDGDVDADDVAIWRTNFGATGEPGTVTGDADDNGAVDGRDFLLLQRYLGLTTPMDAATVNSAVPEPTTASLVGAAIAGAAIAALRRRH